MDGHLDIAASDQEVVTSVRARRESIYPPGLVMIGASTGGPQALVELLAALQPALPLIPVCVTLHMPTDLMPVIAAHITRQCSLPTRIISERCPLDNGIVHFAPGDRYLTFPRSGMSWDVASSPGSPQDFCKMAINKMFSSGASAHGSRALGVVLSGMGTDGLAGARAIVAAGGAVLVQDKKTSAVWGMPGAVTKAELAEAILAPQALAIEIIRRLNFGGRAR